MAEETKGYERQGDLLFVPVTVDQLPANVKVRANGILAEGEATGHMHRVADVRQADVLEPTYPEGNELFLRVGPNGVSIVHDEHGTVNLEPNTFYEVKRAREFDYLEDAARVVED